MRDMSIELEENKINEKMDELAEDWKEDVSVPGFRKGKAPIPLIKSHLGDQLRGESIQRLIQGEMVDLIGKYEPFIYGQPKINNVDEGEGKIKLDFSLDVPPSLNELGLDVDDIKIEEKEGGGVDIDGEIERLREINSELVSVDRKIEEGDSVFIDVEADNNSVSNFSISIKDDKFSSALVGLNSGDEKEIEAEFPEGFPIDELAGKEGSVIVNINEVKEKVKPDLDDEFARDLGFSDLEELKENLRESLEKESEEGKKDEVRDRVIEELLEKANNFELSPGLMEMQKNAGIDEDGAEERVKGLEILDSIAFEKDFEIEESELDEWMERIAESDISDFDELGEESIRFIKQSILREKSIDYILNRGKEEAENREKEEEDNG